ncbi:MAG: hypothetical protein ACFHU9_07420 [Fluviicola sp.]
MSRIKPSHLFWLALSVGLLVRLIIIFQPEAQLLTRWGSDDLYYYSQIAGHVASGDGFTFDGIHPTNGFQPLFLFLLVPLGKWMLHDWYASWVIVSLIVTVLCVLTSFQLRKWTQEMGWSEWLAVILPTIFILHPKILSVTFNGTEAALSFLMLTLTLRACTWMKEKRRFWQAMVVFALFAITRMEFSLVLFFLAVYAMLQGQSMKKWLLVAIGPIVTFSSWMIVNFVAFGHPVPSSGQAKAIHATWYKFSFFEGFKGALGTIFCAESSLSFVIIGLTLIGLYITFRKRDKNLWGVLISLGFASIILMVLTLKTLHGFRDWYFIPQFLLLLILVAHAFEWLTEGRKWYLLLIPASIGVLWGEAQLAPRTFNGPFIIKSCEVVKKIVPKGEKVGVYNAGLPSACLGDRNTVVNLDGVVNNSVLTPLRKEMLDIYAQDNEVRYVLDNKASLLFFRDHSNLLSSPVHVFYDSSNVWQLESVWAATSR